MTHETTLSDLHHSSIPCPDAFLSAKERRKYSILKPLRALVLGAQNPHFFEEASLELEASREVARRHSREASTSFFVPAEVLQRPISQEAYSRAMATTPGSKGGVSRQYRQHGLYRCFAESIGIHGDGRSRLVWVGWQCELHPSDRESHGNLAGRRRGQRLGFGSGIRTDYDES